MVTGILRKLQQGLAWEKISKSQRTTNLIQEISLLIKEIQYLIPMHVRRKGNDVADYLAKLGCSNNERHLDVTPRARIQNIELHSLQLILDRDLSGSEDP